MSFPSKVMYHNSSITVSWLPRSKILFVLLLLHFLLYFSFYFPTFRLILGVGICQTHEKQNKRTKRQLNNNHTPVRANETKKKTPYRVFLHREVNLNCPQKTSILHCCRHRFCTAVRKRHRFCTAVALS